MKDDNCIFCKLAAGDIPTNTVYEDDTFRVIMDANPCLLYTSPSPRDCS
mgnify:FL=1